MVGGWVLKYVIVSITGGFNELAGDPDAAGNVFNTFITDTWSPIIYQVFFMAFCVWVIVNGVKGGIEKWSKIIVMRLL